MMAAEGEAMLPGTLGRVAAAVREAMLAAEWEPEPEPEPPKVVPERRCRFRDCVCPWEFFSLTPRVAPGIDYVCIPDADDNSPAWSLLVGVYDGASSLEVSRLRVARSGRILGRSDDALEVFHKVVLAKPPDCRFSFEAFTAPLPPGSRSLCLLHHASDEKPHPLQLTLQQQPAEELPLPQIEGTTSQCMPISADGRVWALSATLLHDYDSSFSVLMRRLVPQPSGGGRWEQVGGGPFKSTLIHLKFPPWCGGFLQGYAVIPDANLILVSLLNYGLFLTFATDSGRWTPVLTDTDDEHYNEDYLPIFGRGVYVEQHKAVYMLSDGELYAYKLAYRQRQGTRQLMLDPPVKIDDVCPFVTKRGYGFLTHLDGRLMCSVWISLAQRKPCPCDHLHAIVTTFHLPEPGRIQVLHSTYRRLDMVPNPSAHQKFCFLQEYEDQGSPVLQQHEEEQDDLTSSQHVDDPSKMLGCCRNMLRNRKIIRRPKELSLTFSPMRPSGSFPVYRYSRQHQVSQSVPCMPMNPATSIKKELLIICQAGSRSVLYQTGAMDDDDKPLQGCCLAEDDDGYWHIFQIDSKIYAVSSIRDSMLEFCLNNVPQIIKRPVQRPAADPFVMVIRVGGETIGLTDTLQVFHHTQFSYDGSTTWLRYKTDDSDVVGRKVVISGYVAVNDDSFLVCDAVTSSCLLFDLAAKQWRVVMPWAAFKEDWPMAIPTNGLLIGRCVFVDGFIYTCRDGGLAAYELLAEDNCVYLSRPIIMPFSWHKDCVAQDMCLDYAGKDVDPDAIYFYVVQRGEYSPPKHSVRISTIKVKTQTLASKKMMPVGINHVDSVTRFIPDTGAIDLRYCLAVSL